MKNLGWKFMNNIMLAVVLLGLVGCNTHDSVIVHAQSPQPSIPNCFPERFYDGPTETPDYLQFASQACLVTIDVLETYTLKFDHVVQAADMEMGSNGGSAFEWAFWVDFKIPSGRSFSLFMQYDKHVDNVGNLHEWRPFPVPLHLPAGTTVTIRRPGQPAGACIRPGPWAGGLFCATGQKIELVGVINE